MASNHLRDDDEELIAEAIEWARNPLREHRTAIMVLTNYNHSRAVIDRLCEEGWRKYRSDVLQWSSGDSLYVRTSGNMMSGVMVDKLFIHPDCPVRVAAALQPCVKR